MRNHTMTRRVLALLLSLLMIIPSVVFTASAEASGVKYLYSVEHDGTDVVVTLTASGPNVKLNGGAFGITYPDSFDAPNVALNDEVVTDQGGLFILAGATAGANALIGEYYPIIKKGATDAEDVTEAYIEIPEEGVVLATITFENVAVADYNAASITGNAMSVYALEECDTAYTNDKWQVYIHKADELDVVSYDVDATDFEWTVNKYTVTFDYNGGKVDTAESETIEDFYGTTIAAGDVAEPTKADDNEYTYEFLGWATTDDATTPDVTLGEYKIEEDDTLYAVYKATERVYEVTFTGYENDIVDEYGWNETIEAPATAPTKADDGNSYEFLGWSRDDSATAPDENLGVVDGEDITFYPVFKATAKEFDIEYVLDGGTLGENSPEKYTFGEDIVIPDATKTGYEFAGWELTVGEDEYVAGESYGTVTATATWTINTYVLTFEDVDGDGYTLTVKVGGEEVVSGAEVEYGANVTVEVALEEGYEGEYTITPGAAFTMPAEATEITVTGITIKKFTVNFVDENGDEYDPAKKIADVAYGTEVATLDFPEVPAQEGYTGEWVLTTADAVVGEKVVANATYKATYTINKYTVKFVDGETVLKEETLDFGAAIVAPADPEKTGYTFTGWTPAVDATVPAKDVTYEATWEIVTYTITLNAGDDANVDPAQVTYTVADDTVTLPTPTKTGYTFSGWYEGANEFAYVKGETIGDKTLTAKWMAAPVDYTVETYIMDTTGAYGEPTKETKQADADSAISVTPADKTGFTVDTVNSVTSGTATADGKAVLKVYYIRNQYDFTVVVDGVSETEKYYYESAVTVPEEPTKTGYTFTGWTIEGADAMPATMPANDVTVTAKFEIKKYTITWVVDGNETEEEYEYGATPTFKGSTDKAADAQYTYTFKSWTPAIVAVTADATYTAEYDKTVNEYTITWNNDDGSLIDTTTVAFGTVPTHEAATKTATAEFTYTFAGWDPTPVAVTGDATYKATFTSTVNKYTISFVDEGGADAGNIADVEYGTEVGTLTFPAVPAKEGYTGKWELTTAAAVADGKLVANATYQATYTINKYTVKFVDGEKILKEETLDYGTAIVAPADPTKTGYTFKVWNPAVDATVPAKDVTYEATWEIVTYTITLNAGADATVTPAQVTYTVESDTVTLPTPTKTGYAFEGWYEGENKFEYVKGTTTGDKTLTAKWAEGQVNYTVETYTMGTDGQYGTPVTDTKTATTGDTVSVTPETKEGFTVAGTSVLEGTAAADGSTVLKVYYERNQYTFKTVVDGVETPTSYYFEQNVVAPVDPEKTGYEFAGWDNAVPATMPANDVTVTATWTINQYNVKFVVDGTAVYNENLDFGATIVAPGNPTKTGYTFTGWTPAVAEKVPANDVEYTATWEVKNIPVTIPEVEGATVTVTYNDGTQDVVLTKDTENAAIPFDKTFTVKVDLAEGYGDSVPTVTVTGATEAEGVYTMTAETVTIVVADVEKNVYNVTYYEKIGDVETELTIAEAQTTVEHGAAVTLPAVPAKTGYTAGTWVADANYADNKATGDIKFVVTYTINKYTVKYFDGESELTDLAQTYNHGDALALATVPTKDHYTGAWKLTTGTLGENNTVTGELVYTVEWTPVQYKVTYTADNEGYTIEVKNGEDTVASDATVAYNTELTVIVTPKTGYNANAAVIKVNDAAITDGKFNISADSTITVEGVVKNVYNVTYFEKVDGVETEITIDGAQTTVEHGATVALPAVPEKTGYTAGEWTVAEGYTDGVATGNVKIVVTYTINEYTVKYFDGESELTDLAQTYNHGDALALAVVPTKDHYTGAWKLTTGTLGENDTVTGDLVYTVEWTPVQYKVTYTADNEGYTIEVKNGEDTVANDATVAYNTELTVIVTPKTGYNANAAVIKVNDAAITDGKFNISADSTITVEGVVKNVYNVTYFEKIGDVETAFELAEAQTTVEHGATVTLPAVPAKTGYTAGTWVADANYADNKATGDVKFVVTYTINQYTITFNTDGGSAIEPITQNYGTAVTAPADPTKTGYEFAGWDVEIPTTMPAENVTVTATWTINQYTITFDTDGGSAIEPITQDYGTAVTAPADPTKTGYNFIGWDNEIPATIPAEDITIKAIWEINQYTYTFNLDGGTADGELTITADYGSAITAPTNLKKESTAQYSYEFKEWSPAVPATMPENGGTSKAIWTETVRTYKVTAPAGEGYTVDITGADDLDAVAYGTKLTYTVTATEGYEDPTVKVNAVDAALTGEIEVNGDVTIEVTAGALKTYDITLTGENVSTADTLTGIVHGSSKTVTITAAEGYDITAVEADGATVEIADDKASATVTYASVTKAETITVTAAIKTFAVSASTGTGYTATITGAADLGAVAYGTTVTLTVALDAAYTQSEVVVKVGEEVLTAEADGTYKYVVKADTAFDISGVDAKNKYTLTVPVLDAEEDVIAAGTVTDIEHGSVYNGTFTLPTANSQMTDDIAITIDGTAGVATYDPDAKVYKYTIAEVTGEHKVVITGELVLNTYTVKFDIYGDSDVEKTVEHGKKLSESDIPVVADYVDGGITYSFKEWSPAIDLETAYTADATYVAVYEASVGLATITAKTVRAEYDPAGADNYPVPSGLNVVVDATFTVVDGEGADASAYFEISEAEDTITVTTKEGGAPADDYILTIKKQRYVDLVVNFTVEAGETVGNAEAYVMLVGDIVGDSNNDGINDVDGDNVIDIDDYIIAIRAFDVGASVTAQASDVNEDGVITIYDLTCVKTNFGKTSAASTLALEG